MSYDSYGMVIGSAVGSINSIMQQKSINDALEAQAEYNNKLLEMNDKLLSFNQSANLNRANEAIISYYNDIEKQKFDYKQEANQKISGMNNRQMSGITAGNTKERKVQTAYREVGKNVGKIEDNGEKAIVQILEQSRADNERLQSEKINQYNQTLMKNASLKGQQISGLNAALMTANSSTSMAYQGYNIGSGIDNLTTITNETKQYDGNYTNDTEYNLLSGTAGIKNSLLINYNI